MGDCWSFVFIKKFSIMRFFYFYIIVIIMIFRLIFAMMLLLSMAATANMLPLSVQSALDDAGLPETALRVVVIPLQGQVNHPTPYRLSHHANTPSVPASTQKLIVTAAGLDLLGADFRWRTDVYYTGVLIDGQLYGDLIIKGSGEPALTHERLTALMFDISTKIKQVHGNIILDTSRFGAVGYDPNAFDNQGERAYNAEPSAFLVNFGTIELRFVPSGQFIKTEDGEQFIVNDQSSTASVSLLPRLDFMDYPQQVAIGGGCSLPKIIMNGSEIKLNGSFGADCGTQSLWRNFMDNDRLAIGAVTSFWQAHDMGFDGEVVIGKTPINALPLLGLSVVSTYSVPLSKQIHQINHFSNNVMTEQLALSLPLYVDGELQSDYVKSFGLIDRWWQKKIGQPTPRLTRASGLCHDCTITPNQMVKLLQFMYHHKYFVPFLDSLPKAGETGTMKALASRNPNHPAIRRAWIKTGTLKNVTSMAGYVKGVSGQDYAVAMFVNADGAGYHQKSVKVLDEILAIVVSY